MQNHLDISSKTQFWTRSVRNWSKSLTESLRKVYVIFQDFQDLSRRTHKGPYWPIYGPIRVHMGPNPDRALYWVHASLDNSNLIHRPKRDHIGFYVPTLARMGLCGPGPGWARSGLGTIWTLMGPYMGPYGPSWTGLGGLGRFRKLSVETFEPISHVSGPKFVF